MSIVDTMDEAVSDFRRQYLKKFQDFYLYTLIAIYCDKKFCGNVATAAEFGRLSQIVAATVNRECDRVRAVLYKVYFGKLSVTVRPHCSAIAFVVAETTASMFHSEWQTRAAAFYIYNRFMRAESGAGDDYSQLSRVPLRVVQEWALAMRSEFQPLAQSGLANLNDIVAPLSVAVKLALLKPNTPSATAVSRWSSNSDTLVEQFFALAQSMPIQQDKDVLTRHVFRVALKIDDFCCAHKSADAPEPNGNSEIATAIEFVKAPAAMCVRNSMLRFALHVQKEIFAMRQYMPLTRDVEDFWTYMSRQLLDSMDCAISVVSALHFEQHLTTAGLDIDADNSNRLQMSEKLARTILNALKEQKDITKRARKEDYENAVESSAASPIVF